MVDQNARRKAADLHRDFADGEISNEEYEERYPKSESDEALSEIFLQIWFLYSDIQEHKLTGKYALGADQSAFVERCILFLKSDVEFEWPRQQIRIWESLLRFLGIYQEGEEKSDYEAVWPFHDEAQYEQQRMKCKSIFIDFFSS